MLHVGLKVQLGPDWCDASIDPDPLVEEGWMVGKLSYSLLPTCSSSCGTE